MNEYTPRGGKLEVKAKSGARQGHLKTQGHFKKDHKISKGAIVTANVAIQGESIHSSTNQTSNDKI